MNHCENISYEQRQQVQKNTDCLFMRLQQNTLNELSSNPLLLTLIALIGKDGELPDKRVKLYARICDLLFEKWRPIAGKESYSAAQIRCILQPLAAVMMESNTLKLSAEQIFNSIKQPLIALNINLQNELIEFLKAIEITSNLFIEKETHQWAFVHRTFQEYLTACYWSENNPTNWEIYIHDNWWHESIRLYAAQNDYNELIRTCMVMDSVNSLTLAWYCIHESKDFCEEHLRNQLVKLITSYLNSDDLNKRRMADAAMQYYREYVIQRTI